MDYKELCDKIVRKYKTDETGNAFVTLCNRNDLRCCATAITDLLARAEAAEARAEKEEHDMKRIVNRSSYPCEYCTKEKCFATERKRQCYDFVWDSGQKEE